jgi:hypothetical protein
MHVPELRLYEKKVMRKIYGPIQNQDGSWRMGIIEEIDFLTKDADVVIRMKCQRKR